MVEPVKPEKATQRRPAGRSATGMAVFAVTALFACIDSSMDVFTLEEAARIFCESGLVIAQIATCLALVLAGCAIASSRRRGRVEYAAAVGPTRIDEVEQTIDSADSVGSVDMSKVSPQDVCSAPACADADDIAELFDDFDSAVSAELQAQFSMVTSAMEVEQMQRLADATFGARDLMQEAVNAFDASFREDKADVSIEEALNRLEQEVQRRSSGRVAQTCRRHTFSPLIVAFVAAALGLCGACVDYIQAAEICTSTLMEAGVVCVFMPLGYVISSRLKLASSFSAQ